MKKVTQLKGVLTKLWNSGKYTEQEFCDYINNEWLPKQDINGYEWMCELMPHAQTLMRTPPKCIKRQFKEHKEWYVYFYFLANDTEHPVYIGKTYDIGNRLEQHIKEDKKYLNVEYVLCCQFNTNEDALDFEAYYTRHLQPIWNIDNKEAPSKLYKLPTQKVELWAVSNEIGTYEFEQTVKKVKFMREVMIPKFQKVIDSISIKE